MKNKKLLVKIGLLFLFQCAVYFFAKFTPFTVHILGTSLDDKIPLIPFFSIIYVSWYLSVLAVPLIINKYDDKALKKYFISMISGVFICGLFYIFYPTEVITSKVQIKGLFTLILYLVYYFDTPAMNCFPSMHCLICFNFIYYMLFNKKINIKWRVGIIIYSMLVILSTLFTKQHVLIDVLGAFIISSISYAMIYLIYKKKTCK